MTAVSLRRATGDDLDGVVELLAAADLPHADVHGSPATFYLAREEGDLVGAAGLEPCGADALLRSVVVPERHRGRGYGTAIVDGVLAQARADGVERLYLLTTTAADFFADRGFERVPRAAVPDPVRATEEFASLCPDSATVMRLGL